MNEGSLPAYLFTLKMGRKKGGNLKVSVDSDLYFIDKGEKDTAPTLVLTGNWDDRLRSIMLKQRVQYIRLSRNVGWKDQHIDFLKTMNFLKGVEIYAEDIKDLSILLNLQSLEHLAVECRLTVELDVSRFKELKTLFLKWNKKFINCFSVSTLERINIKNYPFEDLIPLSHLTSLRELLITSVKLQTLQGINHLKKLQLLDLYKCNNLSSLESLSALKNLENLEIDSCKNIEELDELKGLERLRTFLIIDCGNIQSIEPLKNCLDLNRIFVAGNTTILDGDFSNLLNLPSLQNFIFVEKKHYKYKEKEIKKILLDKSS